LKVYYSDRPFEIKFSLAPQETMIYRKKPQSLLIQPRTGLKARK